MSKESAKAYRIDNREKAHAYGKTYRQTLKTKFLELYGSICNCCGETEVEFLTIDHLVPENKTRHETSSKAYLLATSSYRPDLFQVLCYNCNCARRHGVCPHKRNNITD
jgi:hypothetical protein